MWNVRKEQLKALGVVRRPVVCDHAVEMLKRHWPRRCEALGDASLDEFVRECLVAAEDLDFSTNPDFLRYCNLTMALGRGWHQSAEFAEESRILSNRALRPSQRLDLLCDRTQDRLDRQF